MQRITEYPMEFWQHININIKNPSAEDIDKAYRTISEFPELQGLADELYEAILTLNAATINMEVNKKIATRYGPSVLKINEACKELVKLMEEDITKTEQNGEILG